MWKKWVSGEKSENEKKMSNLQSERIQKLTFTKQKNKKQKQNKKKQMGLYWLLLKLFNQN